MLSLLDGDLIVYRVGYTTEDVDATIACLRSRDMVERILSQVNVDHFRIFLTADQDLTAFRRQIYPEYKANRVKPRPKWYQDIRDFLQIQYEAEVCYGIEADDALGILQTQNQDRSIICSIDKDLKQIPGYHYHFVKEEKSYVTPEEGLRVFYTQLLTGDSSDHIKGIYGLGPKKAEQILSGLVDEQALFDKVRSVYANDVEMLMNGRCLHIWKKAEDDWINHWNLLI